MLQTQAVSPQLLDVLKKLMEVEAFKPFVLAGGTSLALQIGHRVSVDIDLFGDHELNEYEFTHILSHFGSPSLLKRSVHILVYTINDLKVDFVHYRYPWIEPASTVENIRLASRKDIAAMKLNAISGRGSRKDFTDLYFLLKEYSLSEMLEFYNQKYSQNSLFMVLKSLTYFEDADEDDPPVMVQKIAWERIKNTIREEVKNYLTRI